MKNHLKSCLVPLVRHTGLNPLVRAQFAGLGVILCLHEIHEIQSAELMTGCSPTFLAAVVNDLRRDGWEFVSLDEAVRRIGVEEPRQPFAVLTFDDGYRDNLTVALPVLERLQAPFTVFVPTRAVTGELFAWWLGLRAILLSQDRIVVECMERRFSCASTSRKVAALEAISAWVGQDFSRSAELAPTFAAYGISIEELARAYFLDERELLRLAGHPLVSIGAHSTSHAELLKLETHEARAEMADNKAFLEASLQRDVAHFAYPYGRADAGSRGRDAILARELGFKSALTTRTCPVLPEYRQNLYGLPRVSVRSKDTRATLYYRMSGVSWALKARRRRGGGKGWRLPWS